MNKYRLTKATVQNGLLDALELHWNTELEAYDEIASVWPQIEYAKDVVKRAGARDNFGVYVMHDGQADYVGLGHFNTAPLPKTTGQTLRVVWFNTGPRFNFEEPEIFEVSQVMHCLIHGAREICLQKVMQANHIKVNLPKQEERQFAELYAAALRKLKPATKVAVRGSWLHIDDVA